MSDQERQPRIQRIVVAVDASSLRLAPLMAASSLAIRLNAEVVGIFIEDINLFRLAEMPFIREVSFYSARTSEMSSQMIERQLRAGNRWLQQVIQMLSTSTNIRWSLQTLRGSIPADLLAAVLDTDLLILGRSGLPGMRRIGPTLRSLIEQPPRQALIINQPVRPGSRVIILYDGSESSQKALWMAELVISAENPVTVLLVAPGFEQAQRLHAQAQAELAGAGSRTRYHWLRDIEAQQLARLVQREDCGVLILPAEPASISMRTLLALLDRTDCSVLLVH